MKKKRAFLAIAITALILTVILISLEAYYVAIALIVGTLIIGYRELWSLLKTKRMPPVDERIRENLSKSVRNGFIFFVVALAFLMRYTIPQQNDNTAGILLEQVLLLQMPEQYLQIYYMSLRDKL